MTGVDDGVRLLEEAQQKQTGVEEAGGPRRGRTNRRGSRLGRGVQTVLQSRCHDQLWHIAKQREGSEGT